MRIPYNRNYRSANEERYISDVVGSSAFGAPYRYLERCRSWMEGRFGAEVVLTQSCTDALELAALLCRVGPGDEVILPSFTFSSTATAFALRGAELVFVDIDEESLTIDVGAVAAAVTARTRVVVAVNYAGNPCDITGLRAICDHHDLILVEDAAQSLMTEKNGRQVGSESDLATISFHNTKNVHSGEGGALVLNRADLRARAHILAEKGTNRRAFFMGEVDKYSWVDLGTSALPSELTCALLLGQLEAAAWITELRRRAWAAYHSGLADLAAAGLVTRPTVPDDVVHNGHIYHLRTVDRASRDRLMRHLAGEGISAPFHYVPLHSSTAGLRFGRLAGSAAVTDRVSSNLLRLPLWPEVPVEPVIEAIHRFFASDESGPDLRHLATVHGPSGTKEQP